MLPERKHTILQSLIEEYVASAHPVASSTLVRHYLPRLSPATVRNELNWLEHRGYVAQPHTSAGRTPTTVGYRAFVNSLLLHPLHYHSLLSRSRVCEPPDKDPTQTALNSGSTGAFAGNACLSVLAALAAASDKLALIHEALSSVAEHNKGLMVFWAPQLSHTIIHRGLPQLLSQPEFAETSSALPIMQLLESHGDLMVLFEEIMTTGGLHIKIGSENRDAQFYEFSLVAMQFDSSYLSGNLINSQRNKGRQRGVVALFGPTRMDYEWAISLISNLVQDLECPGH
ncbi:MAG: hypothetical protein LBL23_01745 [Coriobacteriales bacterium]|nr:hypothetical protein [Coriobacteriales bacterium]